ncbi:unnamed protein product [Staurois parvus]|uniref:Uncharacterized protein n=1 Tax=Staurois parvus TaxID=386267 RepID=A0ABN9ANV9_9NEOB|nr:unnamed protein product [Staurois parvus]
MLMVGSIVTTTRKDRSSEHILLSLASALSISLKMSEIVNYLLFFSAFWAFGKVS